jgi:hypothetical protein
MSELRARMIEQLQLHRKAPGTQEQYVQAIAQLAAYYKGVLDDSYTHRESLYNWGNHHDV